MTTREKIGKLLDRLSEEEIASEYRRLRQTVEGFRSPAEQSSGGILRHMTEDEEIVGLSWEEFQPQHDH